MIEELKKLSDNSYNPISFHIRIAIAEYLESQKKFSNIESWLSKTVKRMICDPTCNKPLKHGGKGTLEVI